MCARACALSLRLSFSCARGLEEDSPDFVDKLGRFVTCVLSSSESLPLPGASPGSSSAAASFATHRMQMRDSSLPKSVFVSFFSGQMSLHLMQRPKPAGRIPAARRCFLAKVFDIFSIAQARLCGSKGGHSASKR